MSRDPVGEHGSTLWLAGMAAIRAGLARSPASGDAPQVDQRFVLTLDSDYYALPSGAADWVRLLRGGYWSPLEFCALRNDPIGNIDYVGTMVYHCQWALFHCFIKTDTCGTWGFGPAPGWPFPPNGEVTQDQDAFGLALCVPAPGALLIPQPQRDCFEKKLCEVIAESKASPPAFSPLINCCWWTGSMYAKAALRWAADPCCLND